jgi:hypothetical protein
MNPKVKTVDYMGDLTDELKEYGCNSFIKEFVSGGLKNNDFSVFCPINRKTCNNCKMKGITLNYENS